MKNIDRDAVRNLFTQLPKSFRRSGELPFKDQVGKAFASSQLKLKQQLEAQWTDNRFSLEDCGEEARSDSLVICDVAIYFPRELRHASAKWRADAGAVAEFFHWWYSKIIPLHELPQAVAVAWTKFLINPNDEDEWFHLDHCLIDKFSALPKSLQNEAFIIRALSALPNLSRRILRGKLAPTGDFNLPKRFHKSREFQRQLLKSALTCEQIDDAWMAPSFAKYIIEGFDLEGETLHRVASSRHPIQTLASELGVALPFATYNMTDAMTKKVAYYVCTRSFPVEKEVRTSVEIITSAEQLFNWITDYYGELDIFTEKRSPQAVKGSISIHGDTVPDETAVWFDLDFNKPESFNDLEAGLNEWFDVEPSYASGMHPIFEGDVPAQKVFSGKMKPQ